MGENRISFNQIFCISIFTIITFLYSINTAAYSNADLLQSLKQTQSHINRLATHMGVTPKSNQLYQAKQVEYHDIYFQLDRLYEKTRQLYFENTNEFPPLTQQNKNTSSLEASIMLTDKINHILALLENHLLISNIHITKAQGPEPTNPILLDMLVILNQNINQLVEHETQPGDVYKLITLAVYYADEILNAMPVTKSVDRNITFIPNQKPYNVYVSLLKNIEILKEIGDACHIHSIQLNSKILDEDKISPNDVEDLAQMTVGELSQLADNMNISLKNIDSYYPGKKYPSDVYQRSMLLQLQLTHILTYLKAHPDWARDHCHAKQ